MIAPALALCSSGLGFSCALRTPDGAITTSSSQPQGAGPAELAQQLFCGAGLAPQALREIRIDLGPGSYTGLRVAVTFARVLVAFHGVCALAATSFELMAIAAWRARLAAPKRVLRPVLDARRQRYHVAAVRLTDGVWHEDASCSAGGVQLVEAARCVPREDLLEAVQRDDLVLAAAALHGMLLPIVQARGAELIEPMPHDAAVLFDPALRPRPARAEELLPLYAMASYAE